MAHGMLNRAFRSDLWGDSLDNIDDTYDARRDVFAIEILGRPAKSEADLAKGIAAGFSDTALELSARIVRGGAVGVQQTRAGFYSVLEGLLRGQRNPYIDKTTAEAQADVATLQARVAELEAEQDERRRGEFNTFSGIPSPELAQLRRQLEMAQLAAKGQVSESFLGSLSRASDDLADERREDQARAGTLFSDVIVPAHNDWWMMRVADSLGQSAAGTATTMLNPVLGLSLIYAQTYEGSLAEYQSVAQERGLDTSIEAAERYAHGQALIQTPFELVGDVKIGKAIKGAFGSIPRKVLTSGPEPYGHWIAERTKEIAKSLAGEVFITTPAQTIGESLLAENSGVRDETSWSDKGWATLDAMSIAIGQAGAMTGGSLAISGGIKVAKGDFSQEQGPQEPTQYDDRNANPSDPQAFPLALPGSEKTPNIVNKYLTSFREKINSYLKGTLSTNEILEVGEPSQHLIEAGFKGRIITLTQKILAKANRHGIDIAALSDLPTEVSDPIMIFRSEGRPDNRTMLIEAKAKDGRPVVVSVELGVDRQGKGTVDDVVSIHAKEHYNRLLDWAFNKDLLLYWNKEKSRTFLQDSAPANWEQYEEALSQLNVRTNKDNNQVNSGGTAAESQRAETSFPGRPLNEETKNTFQEKIVPTQGEPLRPLPEPDISLLREEVAHNIVSAEDARYAVDTLNQQNADSGESWRIALTGEPETASPPSEIPRQRNLHDLGGRSDAERLAHAIAGLFGQRIVTIRPEGQDVPQFNAFVSSSRKLKGYIFFRENVARPHLLTAGHELWHSLSVSNPHLAEQVRKLLAPEIRNTSIIERDKAHYRPNERYDEVIGDMLGDSLATKEFWQRLANRNPAVFSKFANVVKNWLDKVTAALRQAGFGSDRYFKDIERVRDILADALVEFQKSPKGGAEKIGPYEPNDPNQIHYSKGADPSRKNLYEGARIDSLLLNFEEQSRKITEEAAKGIPDQSLASLEARYWYEGGVNHPGKNFYIQNALRQASENGATEEEKAILAFSIRNAFRNKARRLMADIAEARNLEEKERNFTWKDIYLRYGGDYEKIIEKSMDARKGLLKELEDQKNERP